jgi:hypothetical protein
MKDQNHKINSDPPDGRSDEPRFDLGGPVEDVEADREFQSLLGKWQAPTSLRALDQRVLLSYRAQTTRLPGFRRILTSSISVPVPVVAALVVVLALAATALLRQRQAPAPQASPIMVERIKAIEVPVVQERVVQRIVYRERKPALTYPTRHKSVPESMSLALASGENSQGYFTDTDLAGFQPNAEMNFKVIKKADNNEK